MNKKGEIVGVRRDSVFFCADPHIGHRNIHKFRGHVQSVEDNTKQFLDEYNWKVRKNTVVYFLGDVAFDYHALELISNLCGRKKLILGNHDDVGMEEYCDIFENVYSMLKYKEFWLTHAPIHPLELRGKKNIHGHVHSDTITIDDSPDARYFNACPEANDGQYLISLNEVRNITNNYNNE